MAIVVSHGFAEKLAAGDLGDYDAGAAPSWSYVDDEGPFGTPCAHCNVTSSARSIPFLLPTPTDEIAVGMWFRWHSSQSPSDNPGEDSFFTVGNANGEVFLGIRRHFSLTHDRLTFYADEETEVAEVDLPTFEQQRWHHIEFSIERLDATDARLVVYFDGIEHADLTVQHPFGGDPIEEAGFKIGLSASTNRTHRFAHLVIDDEGTRHGRCLIHTLLPATQGAHDEWDPADSPGFVNATPPSTDAIEGAAGERTTYDVDALDLLPGTGPILTVGQMAFGRAQALDTDVRGIARRGGADETSPLLGITDEFRGLRRAYWPVDPHTSAPWDPADVDATEFGLAAEAVS